MLKYFTHRAPVIAVILAVQLAFGWAPIIGVAVTHGAFALDNSRVTGNGTLFDGSTVETNRATSELQLSSGVRMVLDTDTRTKVYRGYLLLEKGTSQVENGSSYRIHAKSFEIQPQSNGTARVSLTPTGRVLVSALKTPVLVKTASGLLVAEVTNGHAVELYQQEAGAKAPSTLTGCLQKENGHYILRDD